MMFILSFPVPSVISRCCSPLSLPLAVSARTLFLLTFMFYAPLFYHHISVIALSPHSISSLSFSLHPSIYFSRWLQSGYSVPHILAFLMCVRVHFRSMHVPDMLFGGAAETFTVGHNKGGLQEIYRAITRG